MGFDILAHRSRAGASIRGAATIRLHQLERTFVATSYTTLNIAGCTATLRGEGRLNGRGRHSFLVVASDSRLAGCGTRDRIRVRIWNQERVVFDTNPDAPESAPPMWALERGRITIRP